MGIAQRGTAAVTTNATYGPADRWRSEFAGGSISTTQGSFVSGDALYDTGGAQYFTQVAVTSPGTGASNYCLLSQNIEDVRLLAGQTVTVSFWAKAASGTPSIGVAIDQFFGTGGSAAITGVGQAQALTTTWTKYSKTFTVASVNGKTIGPSNTSYNACIFWLDAGTTYATRSGSIGQSSKTVSIAQVQLEVGAVATPFEQRPYGMELALCQRYLPTYIYAGGSGGGVFPGQCVTTTNAYISIPFQGSARVIPTGISISAAGDFLVTALSGASLTTTAVTFSISNSLNTGLVLVTVASGLVGGNATLFGAGTGTAKLLFTGCEL